MITLSILGSTGSIGSSTLDVVRRSEGAFRVAGLAAGGNIRVLDEQIRRFRPRVVSVRRPEDAAGLRRRFRGVRFASGSGGAEDVAALPENDVVVAAIPGIQGLGPTLAAVRAGKRVALANKESLVAAGAFLRREASKSGAEILPVDSEHSGVFQCLAAARKRDIRRVILTASGGPFFRTSPRALRTRTVADALRHPSWKMGKKVTVDSATLMNKGLELIEARWLFDLPPEKLDVLVHPQSVVHALVELTDGSVLAQLSATDMRVPIQYALTWPKRSADPAARLDLAAVGRLEFYDVDEGRFPLFALARRALREGGSLPAALNAANEAAVEAFLAGRLAFPEIAEVVAAALETHVRRPLGRLEDVYVVDAEARAAARRIMKQR